MTLTRLHKWIASLALVCLATTGFAQSVQTVSVQTLFEPYGIIVDQAANLYYFTDSVNNRVVRYSPATNTVVSIAPGAFFSPQGIVFARGGLVVADSGRNSLKFVTLGGTVTTIAGGVAGFADGTGTAAQFRSPSGLAIDAAGNIYVADPKNNAVRKLSPGNVVTTVATNLNEPAAVALDNTGRLFVADTRNHAIKLINPDGSTTLIAGSEGLSGFADGSGLFDTPRGLTWVGGDTGLLIADSGNNAIRSLSQNAETGAWFVNTLSGFSGVRGFEDGQVRFASFAGPTALAVDSDNIIVVADLFNDALRRIVRQVAQTPSVSPIGGRYTNSVTLSITNSTPGTVFHHTTDGSDPSPLSPVAGNRMLLSGGPLVPLKLRAFSPDFAASLVVSNLYSFEVDELAVTTKGGTFQNDIALGVTTRTSNSIVRFTADGSAPTTNSPVWVDRIYGVTAGLQFQGFRDGFAPSAVVTNNYIFAVSPAVVDPDGAKTNRAVRLEFGSFTAGAQFYWTIDGSIPTTNSTLYTGPFYLGTNGPLKVLGVKPGYVSSVTSGSKFELQASDPEVNVAGVTTNNSIQLILTTATDQSEIYYTLDGSDPSRSNGTKYTGAFQLGTAGNLRARTVRPGFLDSNIKTWAYSFAVSAPTVTPGGASGVNPVRIELASDTKLSQLYWTIDGTEPATNNGVLYSGPFYLGTNGTLRVKAFRNGFADSPGASFEFNLKAALPVTSPAGGVYSNDVPVVVVTDTTNAVLRFSTNGTAPTASSPVWGASGAPVSYGINGTLSLRAFQNGFVSSDVNSNSFTFLVAAPTVAVAGVSSRDGSAYVNSAKASASTTTTAAQLFYTVDGSDPRTSVTALPLAAAAQITFTANTTMRVAGLRSNYLPSDVVTTNILVQVPTPQLTPPSGYFPQGTLVTATVPGHPEAKLYYRLDGQTPTTNDLLYSGPVKVDALSAPNRDLRSLAVRAFIPNLVPSDVVRGQPVATNSVGVPVDIVAGIGATALMPVVANLGTDQPLRSLQFRIEVSPLTPGAPILENDLRPLAVTTNDFVPIVTSSGVGSSTVLYSTYTTNYGGVVANGLIVAAIGTNANVNYQDFGTVSMLAVPIPVTAREGDQYSVRVLSVSGTTNAQQAALFLTNLPSRTITVSNINYLVGDTAPGRWYNAGDFGNGGLDNADVNNVFYASLGVHVPYTFSDAFDAMDIFPEDTATSTGGEGRIRFLDWQYALYRSLGVSTNNWQRRWSAGGVRVATPRLVNGNGAAPGTEFSGGVSGSLLKTTARVQPGTPGSVTPGNLVKVPVRVRVKDGLSLAGLQFRIAVRALESAPAVGSVSFAAAAGVPDPLRADGVAANEVGVAWSLVLNSLPKALTGETVLGTVQFTVPISAQQGEKYVVEVINADGAESAQVGSEIDGGSVILTVLGLSTEQVQTLPGFKLNWFAFAGHAYAIESTEEPIAGKWISEQADVPGRGRMQEFVDHASGVRSKFYRIRSR